MIDVVNLTHHYGIRPVLRDLSLRVEPGELVGLMGPNGMGKSTLLGVMAGVLSPIRGHVEINGRRRRGSVEEELAIRREVVYLPDHPWLPQNMSGREFLLAVGRLYDIEDDRLMDHVDRLLRLFNLAEHGDNPIRSYSNGQKKKAAICSALVAETPILLLDEPFSGGLDPAAILALKRVLQRRVREKRATVVMATPVPELVDEIATRVAIIRDGCIIAYDTPAGLRQSVNCLGPLQEVLERLISPETLQNIDEYFAGAER